MQAAFFDLDKTVIARSSTLAFGRPFFKEGLIGRGDLARGIYAQLVYLIAGADEDKMEKMRAALLHLTQGWEREKLASLVQETLSEVIDPIIYEEAITLVEEHLAAGRRVYLISSSGEEIVVPVAAFLGIPHAIGTRAKLVDGRYTGELEFYCYGEGKREAILAEAEVHRIDLARSYAYSDSATDLPMLEAVGNPHAVNPDRQLRAVAESRDWPILTFRNPVSVRARFQRTTAIVAERGREVAREMPNLARQVPRVAPQLARQVPTFAREVPQIARRRPYPSALIAAVGLIALIGWAYMRRRRDAMA